MAMIPTSSGFLSQKINVENQPSRTYRMHVAAENIIGKADDLLAIEQAIYKILNTERYQYLIYSWNYGIELADLFGMPIPYVYSEVKRRITEALLADDRISDVKNFELFHKGGDVSAKFEVVTKYGTIKTSKEVKFA